MVKVLVLFYSTYGHLYQMAKSVAEGAAEIEGAQVTLKRVPETLSEDVLQKLGALDAQKTFADVPVAEYDELDKYDVILFGSPTRFGTIAAQLKHYMDATGALWASGALVGKVGGFFTSTATQHGGQESTILSFHTVLLHHGFIIAGLPYSFQGQNTLDAISGGSPYGASTIAGGDGSRVPSQNELEGAKFQGRHTTDIGRKLAAPLLPATATATPAAPAPAKEESSAEPAPAAATDATDAEVAAAESSSAAAASGNGGGAKKDKKKKKEKDGRKKDCVIN